MAMTEPDCIPLSAIAHGRSGDKGNHANVAVLAYTPAGYAWLTEPLALYNPRPPAVIITLNRADKRNALSRGLIDALKDAFQRARDDPAVRCVILTGAGSVFCAGMDLAELQESLGRPADATPVWDDALRLATLYDLIYTLPKPTVAAVNGEAVAGGAGLVTVCDLAVAGPE